MRTAIGALEVVRPRHRRDALARLAEAALEDRPLTPLAGGTDLYVYLNAGESKATRFLDLWSLDDLRGIRVDRKGVRIGALTTFRDLREHAAVRKRLPSLVAAAREVGALPIQNRATIAGNIANASPAGDSLPVLLAHDAVVTVESVRGRRTIPFEALYHGYRALAIDPDELIVEVFVPAGPARAAAFFRKVGTRRAQSISKVVFAGVLVRSSRGRIEDVRLAFGSMAATPARARHAEQALRGRALDAAAAADARAALADDFAPIDDIRSEARYRATVAGNVLDQFLRGIGRWSQRA
jgi:CO/xanthine dehydrogenase FAD-binding subunit